MRKTTSYPSSSSDALSVDTAGLQKMLNSGRQTATQIGMEHLPHCTALPGDLTGQVW